MALLQASLTARARVVALLGADSAQLQPGAQAPAQARELRRVARDLDLHVRGHAGQSDDQQGDVVARVRPGPRRRATILAARLSVVERARTLTSTPASRSIPTSRLQSRRSISPSV